MTHVPRVGEVRQVPGTYGAEDRERWVAEDPDPEALPRSDFERDRARILHSSALRRLAAKTQVVVVGEDDFPRTRLTHSLEVAQIGRSMAESLGCDPDLVEGACLAHDLGHPPFGHTGEGALDKLAADFGGFEGNAQTFRILTRLEAKVLRPDGASAGLNLTRASLDAAIKYPWPREMAEPRTGTPKFGVYAEDRPAFDWVRSTSPAADTAAATEGRPRRCLEAQVMDWADDIAYSVHDVEDAVHGGHLDLELVRADSAERAALCALAGQLYSPEDPAYLEAMLDDLLGLPAVRDLPPFDGGRVAQAALKQLTSTLISHFIAVAVRRTLRVQREPSVEVPASRYHLDLEVPREERARCALLKAMAARYVMMRAESRSRRRWQQEVISDLVTWMARSAPEAMAPAWREAWAEAGDDATRRRVVIDAVASMTDTSALAAHAALRARLG